MVRSEVIGVLVAALALAPRAEAQQQQPTANKWVVARCDIKPGHFLVTSGVLYLKSATETRFEDQRQKDLRDARNTLTQAVTTGNQDKNPAAWYYFGRYYLMVGDLVGADSTLKRAQALKPECAEDIGTWRKYYWVSLFNAGIAAWQGNNPDSAIASFRRANAIYDLEPTGFKYQASLLYQKGTGGEPDTAALGTTCRATPNTDCAAFVAARWNEYKTAVESSMVYFRRAADIAAKDPKWSQDRRDALFNLARIYHSRKEWKEAEATYREYLTVFPNDAEGLASLGSVLSQTGQRDSAFALYRRIIANADSASATQMFRVGVEIFQAVSDPPDTSAAGKSCRGARATPVRIKACRDSLAGVMKEYDTSSRVTYRLAAQAFEAGLKANPFYRDGLFNLVNAYMQADDSAQMLPIARRLVTVDPMNRTSLRLLAFAHQRFGHVDSTLHYLRQADSTLVTDVTITEFSTEDQSAAVKGLITNMRNTASKPFKLVFEFLNSKGDVVATQADQVAEIPAQGTHQIDLKAIGAGIQAWRYHKEE